MTEDKSQRFKRLASSRTNDVLKRLKVLSNCSNKSSYSYTTEEIEKIFNTIDKAVKQSKDKFKSSKKREEKFKL